MLYYKIIGKGEPIVILHGLFGTSDNWRTFARMLKDHYQVILVDLRNHGRSFWSDEFNYTLMSEDVIEVLDHLKIYNAHLLGHSMGGKVAITIADFFPKRVKSLIVVDIGIKQYSPGHTHIFEAILAMNPSSLTSRTEADETLSKSIEDVGVRQFLMKSLSRSSEGGFKWKTNFKALSDQYVHILSELKIEKVNNKTIFIRGTTSNYITDEDLSSLRQSFSLVHFKDINAGHWVHVEQTEELFTAIISFLSDDTLE